MESTESQTWAGVGIVALFPSRPELTHVRTRHRSPGSNGVRERGFGTLKYEQLYRHDIDDGIDLARHVENQRQIFNTRRPHEALDWRFLETST